MSECERERVKKASERGDRRKRAPKTQSVFNKQKLIEIWKTAMRKGRAVGIVGT